MVFVKRRTTEKKTQKYHYELSGGTDYYYTDTLGYYEPVGLAKELIDTPATKTYLDYTDTRRADIDIKLMWQYQPKMNEENYRRSVRTIRALLKLHGPYKPLPRKRKCQNCKEYFQPQERFVYYCQNPCLIDKVKTKGLIRRELQIEGRKNGN